MALEIWKEGQRQKGNKAAVKKAEEMLKEWGDVPVDNVKTETRLAGKPSKISVKDSEAYRRAREALERKGMTVFVIKPKSVAELLDENEQHFGYVNPSQNLIDIVPQAMEVAIDTNHPAIPGSGNLPLDRQLAMTSEYEGNLRRETGLKNIKAGIDHASVYCQLDIAYQEQNLGKVLFPDFFARTPDKTVGSNVAYVGRGFPDYRLNVLDWYADDGHPDVQAVPVVVLPPRK